MSGYEEFGPDEWRDARYNDYDDWDFDAPSNFVPANRLTDYDLAAFDRLDDQRDEIHPEIIARYYRLRLDAFVEEDRLYSTEEAAEYLGGSVSYQRAYR